MPPKSRITRQMILDASIALVSESGIQNMNVRSVAARLKCSTQPIMYHFSTMEELKNEIYVIILKRYTTDIMDVDLLNDPKPCFTISKRFIAFAMEKQNLFHFLFQSGRGQNYKLSAMMASPQFSPLINVLAQRLDLTTEQSFWIISSVFVAVHGLCCLLTNNAVEYDPSYTEAMVDCIFNGALSRVREHHS